jgi:hypothetical protein
VVRSGGQHHRHQRQCHDRQRGYPDKPSGSDLLDEFDGPVDWADNYGTRLYGWLKPPQTGDYTFWVAGDDETQLWLSTDMDPDNALMIANLTGWTPHADFDNTGGGTGGASQKSAAIPLQAGQKYYLMALSKDGTGGDSCTAAWQGPGVATRAVIAGEYVDTFALPPLQAFLPSPANGAVDVSGADVDLGAGKPRSMRLPGRRCERRRGRGCLQQPVPGQQTEPFDAGSLAWGKLLLARR